MGNGGKWSAFTHLLINSSHWFDQNFVLIAVVAGVAAYLSRMYVRTTEGRIVSQRALLNFPLFGDLIQKSEVAQFSRTISTLLESGVSMVDSLDICKAELDHVVFEDAVGEMKKEIELGSTVSAAMHRQKIFPKMATQMIDAAENNGSIDKVLEQIADFYEEEVQNAVQNMMKWMEPFMLVFLGGTVGGLLISMVLLFQMAGNTK